MCELSETRFPTWENGAVEEAKKQNKPKMGARERENGLSGRRTSERASGRAEGPGKKVIKGQMKRKNSEREDGGVKKVGGKAHCSSRSEEERAQPHLSQGEKGMDVDRPFLSPFSPCVGAPPFARE